jgi:hypothetical protein
MFASRVSLPAEHAGQFGDAVFAGEEADLENRAAGFDLPGGDVMRRGWRNRRQETRSFQYPGFRLP